MSLFGPGPWGPPGTASVLFDAGQSVPNLAVVPVGGGGKVSVFNQRGQVHVILDVVGWFDDGTVPAEGLFRSVAPVRVLDSRGGNGGWFGSALGEGQTRDVTIAGANGVPVSATGVVANVTVTGGSKASYVQAFPSGQARPGTANVLFSAGQTVPNLVTVGLGANGKVSLFNQLGSVHVIVDVVGYFDPTPGGSRFHALSPTRLLDSRSGVGLSGPWNLLQTRNLGVAGVVPVAGDATGLVANVTVTGGAVAVTIPERVTGFRGWRRRWWERDAEVPFPGWRTATMWPGQIDLTHQEATQTLLFGART